jgi:hypothetical protein
MEGSELQFIEELKATVSNCLKSGDDIESVERFLFSFRVLPLWLFSVP